jgi:uncharacterized coiled-coil protein SlyX
MNPYEHIVAEREAKIAKLEQLIKEKDQELVEMYKEIQYFYDKLKEKKE